MPGNIVDQIGLGAYAYYPPMAQSIPTAYIPRFVGQPAVQVTPSPQTQRNVVQLTPIQQQQLQAPVLTPALRAPKLRVRDPGGRDQFQRMFGPGVPDVASIQRRQIEAARRRRESSTNSRRTWPPDGSAAPEPSGALVDTGVGDDNVEVNVFQFGDQVERNIDEAVNSLLRGPETIETIPSLEDSIGDFGVSMSSGLDMGGSGLGVGNIADAFDEPQIHSSEQAAAETDQEKILDEEERTELDKYNHPLSDEWVKKLPPYDRDLKPAEMCVMDCKERTRIHDLECDEVRRRVTKRLNDLGCLTRWVAIPQKSPCS